MMKKVKILSLIMMIICFTSCGKDAETENAYCGTWKAVNVETDGSIYTIDELSAQGMNRLNDFYFIINEDGTTFISAEGKSELMNWAATEYGITLGSIQGTSSNGKVYLEYNGLKFCFEKISDVQTYPLSSDDGSPSSDDKSKSIPNVIEDEPLTSEEATTSSTTVYDENPVDVPVPEASYESNEVGFGDSTSGNTENNYVGDTVGQKNAVRAAKNYLYFNAFSREGLIHQLEFEGYTSDEAIYGTDNSGADWMEQAVKAAKNYLYFSAFSRDGLIHQLEFEGFTSDEALYGANNSGADWMEQAAKAAKNYLDNMPFSREGLIEQLEYEGYTYDQAEYGVNSVGL